MYVRTDQLLLLLFLFQIVIQQGCRFISSLVGALGEFPGGMGRFLPCRFGGHRLHHLGWEQCSHWLTSGPWETCVLGYPSGAAAELLDGSLKLRCCTTHCSSLFSPWCVPGVGGLAGRREGEGHATSDHLDDAVVVSKGSG